MTTTSRPSAAPPARPAPRPRQGLARGLVGGFFLVMGGVHLGLVTTDPDAYGPFADHALLPFVREGWSDIVMLAPSVYGLLLMAGEVTIGALLLLGGRAATVGWVAAIGFHVLLLLFGWWAWAWSVPALALLTWLAWPDLRDAGEGP